MAASFLRRLLIGTISHIAVTGAAVWLLDRVRRYAPRCTSAAEDPGPVGAAMITPTITAGAGEDWGPGNHRETVQLCSLANYFEQFGGLQKHDSDMADDVFVRLDDLRWLLADYVLHGARIRHLVELPTLSAEVVGWPAGESDAQHRLHAAAQDVLSAIRVTNEVTYDWLLAHRVGIPDPDFLDSNALLDRYRRLELEPHTVSSDPLYLLVGLIHDALETAEQFDKIEDGMLERFEAQLTKPLAAIELEIASAMAFNHALVGMFPDSYPTEAA